LNQKCKIYGRKRRTEKEKEKEEKRKNIKASGTPRPRDGKRPAAHLPSLRTGTLLLSFSR
jgi:hypothetical protein